MLKWIKRAFLSLLAFAGVALITGIAFEQWSRRIVAREYQPNGQLFEVDGRAMHLHCSGAGEPTVVLQSGWDFHGSLAWVRVQPEIAKTNRVCSYDRAGILWSDGRKEAPRANRMAERLHRLLDIASEKPPYVLVGHSFGGPLTMVFADRYRQDAKGVVLVDSSHPEQMERVSPEVAEIMGGPSPVVTIIAAATGLMRLSESGMDGYTDETQVALEYHPQSVSGLLAEFAELETIFGEARGAASFGDLPLVVLTAGKQPDESPPEWTPELNAEFSRVWSELQIELAALSTNGELRVIDDAEHYMQYYNPDAVIQAIRDVVTNIESTVTGGQPGEVAPITDTTVEEPQKPELENTATSQDEEISNSCIKAERILTESTGVTEYWHYLHLGCLLESQGRSTEAINWYVRTLKSDQNDLRTVAAASIARIEKRHNSWTIFAGQELAHLRDFVRPIISTIVLFIVIYLAYRLYSLWRPSGKNKYRIDDFSDTTWNKLASGFAPLIHEFVAEANNYYRQRELWLMDNQQRSVLVPWSTGSLVTSVVASSVPGTTASAMEALFSRLRTPRFTLGGILQTGSGGYHARVLLRKDGRLAQRWHEVLPYGQFAESQANLAYDIAIALVKEVEK